MSKAGYDFGLSSSLGELNPDVTREMTHGLSETQKKWKEQGYTIDSTRAGLGFTHVAPVKIYARRKENKAKAQHISVEAVEEKEEPKAIKKASVFDRLAKPTQQTSVFSPPHKSALERLGVLSKPSEEESQRELESGVHVDSTEDNEIRSLIPSRMKRHSLDITSGDQLKVKRQTIIRTQKTLSQQNESDDEESEILVVHHVTIKELGLKLGTNEDPRPIFVSALLNPSEEESYHQMLLEYKNVFTWTYKEMPGLDPKVAVHHLAVKPGMRLIKQTQRRFRPELLSQIEAEVDKLIAVGFIREVKYPTWIANIVPVKKKIIGQIRICVDFRDLNEACLKDDFPLPIIELMVDSTTGHEALSFMDGSSGYNQIRMWLEDEELTAFRTPKGIYCYNVMPFGRKNAGATYQCAMQKIFGEMLHKNVECYVDDLMIK
ncbi:unnamed protein product [Prunus armeniaca]